MLFTTVFQACSHPETQLHVAMCGCVSRKEDELKRKMTNGEASGSPRDRADVL
jgi:hypothetical protein